jgi:hypothetical protein
MNPAELVMNCPDLRSLILSHRTESMKIDDKNKIKRKMALCLNDIKNNVNSPNGLWTKWTKIDSDGDWVITCYCYWNNCTCAIFNKNIFSEWCMCNPDLYEH